MTLILYGLGISLAYPGAEKQRRHLYYYWEEKSSFKLVWMESTSPSFDPLGTDQCGIYVIQNFLKVIVSIRQINSRKLFSDALCFSYKDGVTES